MMPLPLHLEMCLCLHLDTHDLKLMSHVEHLCYGVSYDTLVLLWGKTCSLGALGQSRN